MNYWFEAVLRSYGVIFFTDNRWIGLILLLATFLAPVYGIFGLVGALVAVVAATWLGFDRKTIRTGAYSFNSLLTCMALAYLSHFQWDLTWRDGLHLEAVFVFRMLVLVIGFSLVAFFVTIVLNQWLKVHFGLPSMSLPFVISAGLLYFLFYSFTRTPIASVQPDFLIPAVPKLPAVLQTFLESFGAIFFLPNVVVGSIVVLCIFVSSRLMIVYGAAAFLSGIGFMSLFGYQITSGNLSWLGFNFLFSGMVLGGVFFIPSRASLPLAMVSAFFCAAVAIAIRSLFWNFNIPPLAMPFNLVVLSTVYALGLRPKVDWLFANPFPDGTPELNFSRFHSQRERFPDSREPSVHLPFHGRSLVTQAFDGDITHVGDYRHAYDFEAVDEDGKKFSSPGDSLADFYTFGSEVLSPADGTVVQIVDHVKDNPIGRNNLVENWGNLVVILLDTGIAIQLSHFKHRGIVVSEGERVTKGTVLGFCGNSGRSPVPHLHLQLQNAAVVGAVTVPFGVRNYIDFNGDEAVYRYHGTLELDDLVAPLETDPEIESIFSELTGNSTFRWDDETVEQIKCRIDSIGQTVFESDRGSRLICRTIDNVFHCIDFQGNSESILSWFRLALGRVPFSSLENLKWEDTFSVRPFLSPVDRMRFEIFATFAGFAALRTESRFAHIGKDRIRIETKLSNPRGRAPRELLIEFQAGEGITRLESDRGNFERCD